MLKNNNYQWAATISIASSLLDQIILKAQNTVKGKRIMELSKKYVFNQANNVISTILSISAGSHDQLEHTQLEHEPFGPKIDNLACSNIPVKIQQCHKSKSNQNASKLRTMSINSNKHETVKEQSQKFEEEMRKLSELQQDQQIAKIRQLYITELKYQENSLKESQKRKLEDEKMKLEQQKLHKRKDQIIFDYSGNIISLGKPSQKVHKPILSKVNLNTTTEEITKTIDRKNQEISKVEFNDRTTQSVGTKKQKPLELRVELNAAQKNIISSQYEISKGVKLIELKGDKQQVKEPRQNKYDSSFLKYKLKEYKEYIRERKFKEHHKQEYSLKQSSDKIPIKQQSVEQPHDTIKTKPDRQVQFENASHYKTLLPQIKPNTFNSSKYLEQAKKDLNKTRVKSTKLNSEQILSSLYYKEIVLNHKQSSTKHASVANIQI